VVTYCWKWIPNSSRAILKLSKSFE
jgi:hypothetical protein